MMELYSMKSALRSSVFEKDAAAGKGRIRHQLYRGD